MICLLPDADRWKNLKAIGIAINNTMRDGVMVIAIRYRILSKYISGKRFAEAVRGHWGIAQSPENNQPSHTTHKLAAHKVERDESTLPDHADGFDQSD